MVYDDKAIYELSCELVSLLSKKGLTLSVAESCTGGLIAKSITDVPGVSSVFYGGVVSYDNSVKMNILGVCEKTLMSVGAVSSECACQMASGVKCALKTDVSLSTTGIAGPGGATPTKPVGTVWVGLSANGSCESSLLSIDSSLSREEIRRNAAYLAIKLLIKKISENY